MPPSLARCLSTSLCCTPRTVGKFGVMLPFDEEVVTRLISLPNCQGQDAYTRRGVLPEIPQQRLLALLTPSIIERSGLLGQERALVY